METMRAPGTWCTDWAFMKAVADSGARTFIEVGSGEGRVAAMLCDRGLTGVGIEPAPEVAVRCRERLIAELSEGRFRLHQGLLSDCPDLEPADLVYSQMVLEHIVDDLALVQDMVRVLKPGGTLLAVVPARPERWGAEDDLAGHVRRYRREGLNKLFTAAGLGDVEVASLNVPVSNLLHRFSDRAVARANQERAGATLDHRTRLSGVRDIPYKDRFPAWAGLVLNPLMMWPLCQLQRAFFDSEHGLVLLARGRLAAAAVAEEVVA